MYLLKPSDPPILEDIKNTECGFTILELSISLAVYGIVSIITIYVLTLAWQGSNRWERLVSTESALRLATSELALDISKSSYLKILDNSAYIYMHDGSETHYVISESKLYRNGKSVNPYNTEFDSFKLQKTGPSVKIISRISYRQTVRAGSLRVQLRPALPRSSF